MPTIKSHIHRPRSRTPRPQRAEGNSGVNAALSAAGYQRYLQSMPPEMRDWYVRNDTAEAAAAAAGRRRH